MKDKLRLLIGLSILVCFLTTIMSCEAEKEYSDTVNTGYRLRKINFDQLKSRKEVFSKFEKASRVRQNSQMERIVYNEEYGLYFDIDNIIYIEKEGYESYTIPLLKEPNDSLVKNLVLYHKLSEPIKAKLMGYKLTNEEIERLSNHEYVDVSYKTYSSILTSDYALNSSASWYDDSGCLVTLTATLMPGSLCSHGLHYYGQACDATGPPTPPYYAFAYTYGFCLDGSVNGGTISIPTSPTNPSGGTGDGTSGQTPIENPPSNDEDEDEVVTTPIIPGLEETPNDPCAELKAKTQNTVFNTKINYLNSPLYFNQDKENGFIEKRDTINTANISYMNLNASPNTHRLEFSPNIIFIGYAHVHNNNLIVHGDEKINVKIFSPADLLSFAFVCQRNARYLGLSSKDTYAMMISSQGTFALKMLTPTPVVLSTLKWKKLQEEYELKVQDLQDDNNLNSSSLQKMFLTFLKNYGIDNNIGLYKATNSNLTNWSRVTLNENGILEETPCN